MYLPDKEMSSSNKPQHAARRSWMTDGDDEDVNAYLFIHGCETRDNGDGTTTRLCDLIPSGSQYYDPYESEDPYDFCHCKTSSVWKRAKPTKPAKPSTNRFAVLRKIPENATSWNQKNVNAKRK